jgi:stearoyl-CoA desaturase (delta-9 desaturase)
MSDINGVIRSDSAKPFQWNWTNLIFFSSMYGVGLSAWPVYVAMGGEIHWQEIAVFIFMFFLGTFSITIGYHRALAHKSFKMSRILKTILLIGGSSTAEGSAIGWCADHRRHHKFQDTDQDPYNVRRGFWWAHIGWIVGAPTSDDFSNCPDLQRDRLLSIQHRHYIVWMIGSSFVLPLVLGILLGRPIACFLLAGFTRIFCVNQVTYLINSYAHYFGRRPYSTAITARDSLICALLANGEGWHNFHHKFPFDYRNGHRFFHYDPTKWFVLLSRLVGMASSLKTTPPQEIYRARIQTQRAKMVEEPPHLKSLSEQLDAALEKWTVLGIEWECLKSDFERRRNVQVRAFKRKMREARVEFKHAYANWQLSRRKLAPAKVKV